MNTDGLYQFAADRHEAIRQEAEQHHLIGANRPDRHQVNYVRRAISLTGDILIAAGTRLKSAQPAPAAPKRRMIRQIR